MLRANSFLLPAVTAFRRGQSHAGHRALVVLAARNRGRLRDPYDTPLRDGNRDRLYGLLTQRSVATLLHYLSVRAGGRPCPRVCPPSAPQTLAASEPLTVTPLLIGDQPELGALAGARAPLPQARAPLTPRAPWTSLRTTTLEKTRYLELARGAR